MMSSLQDVRWTGTEIAVIGMAARLPGAASLEEFWKQQEEGATAISFFSDQELQQAGVPKSRIDDPDYVRARAILGDVDLFDATFFGFTPRQAEITDPQHRLFLETVHHVLEDAGYDPFRYQGRIGVFAGSGLSSYVPYLYSNPRLMKMIGGLQAQIANDKDFLTTLACYKLNLRGPGITVQTACSTSLVAIHLACQSLLAGECDMAIAGGVSITLPEQMGYLYQEGGVHSPDGYCRVFDARAQGTVGGNGVAVAMLKPLEKALQHGDRIRAIVLGSAINNDGNDKAGYTAPGFAGQVRVVREAHATAGIDSETVSYLETHGTGTILGDPIEVEALIQAFRNKNQQKDYCALGAVKANIGHLDTAAGAAGFIRTVLALEHQRIPPCANFQQPNPAIHLDDSPFYIPGQARDWNTNGISRRAGVSSFGIGGTNAHIVLQEAPARAASGPSREWQPIILSAASQQGLEQVTRLTAQSLVQSSDSLADVAYTLACGRRQLCYRRALVARNAAEAEQFLRNEEDQQVFSAITDTEDNFVVFLFPGGGTQYPGMARGLYHSEPVFRAQMDSCLNLLQPHFSCDLRSYLYPESGEPGALMEPSIALPALFAVEYSLARLFMHWGITPKAVLGHSLGEYVAACIAEIMSLEDALALVALRGELLERIPAYEMASVSLGEKELRPMLPSGVEIVALNGPLLCTVAGLHDQLESLEDALAQQELELKRIKIRAASHCGIVDPILGAFDSFARGLSRRRPVISCLSNVTGDWISEAEISDPHYWSKHLRQTVRFSDCLSRIVARQKLVLIEMGPGKTLCSLARIQPNAAPKLTVTSLRHALEEEPDQAILAKALGQLWTVGLPVDWGKFYQEENRRRVQLSLYPLERCRHWVEPGWKGAQVFPTGDQRQEDPSKWFYAPSWLRSLPLPVSHNAGNGVHWLIFADTEGMASRLVERLRSCGGKVKLVYPGEVFQKESDDSFRVNPTQPEDYDYLLQSLSRSGFPIIRIVHCWTAVKSNPDTLNSALNLGYYSLIYLARALTRAEPDAQISIFVISAHSREIIGGDLLYPERAMVLGPCRVLPQEHPNFRTCAIDLDLEKSPLNEHEIEKIVGDLLANMGNSALGYRGGYRWQETLERIELPLPMAGFRKNGVYLITGGLGRIGLELAKFLAETVQARVVLTTRRKWPLDASDPDSTRVNELLSKIAKVGGEGMILTADSREHEPMQRAIQDTMRAFGRLNGVFHCPSIAREHAHMPIQEIGRTDSQSHFAAKVEGTYVLSQVVEGLDLDFCILFSSLASILGGLGFCAYTAANLFQDEFVHLQRRRSRVPWLSINWEGWRFDQSTNGMLDRTIAQFALSPDDGRKMFQYLPDMARYSQIAISTGDLRERKSNWILSRQDTPLRAETNKLSSGNVVRSKTFSPPQTNVQKIIASIWTEHLGVSDIGLEDNFYSLGGTSLLATHCMARLRQELKVSIPLRAIFINPTVGALAIEIEAILVGTRSTPSISAEKLHVQEQIA